MIHWYDEVGSTQDVAAEMVEAGAPSGTAVVARVQAAGRGTKGRAWSSGLGGLWMSVVLRLPANPTLEVLSLRIGLGLSALIDRLGGRPGLVALKWPNDLIVDDRKLGGILIEGRWLGNSGAVIVGVGLNVANAVAPEVRNLAIRLHDAGVIVSAEDLAQPVVGVVTAAGRAAGSLTAQEQDEFRRRDWLAGKRIEQPVVGTAIGITPSGRLIVQNLEGEAQVIMGPITLPALAPSEGLG